MQSTHVARSFIVDILKVATWSNGRNRQELGELSCSFTTPFLHPIIPVVPDLPIQVISSRYLHTLSRLTIPPSTSNPNNPIGNMRPSPILLLQLLASLGYAEHMSASPRLDIPSRTSSANPAQPFDFSSDEYAVEDKIQRPVIPTDEIGIQKRIDVRIHARAAGPEALFSLESGFPLGFGGGLRARKMLISVASRIKKAFGARRMFDE